MMLDNPILLCVQLLSSPLTMDVYAFAVRHYQCLSNKQMAVSEISTNILAS
jgi:hypothetical protein